jgi:preprotein translocase subunit SecB
MPALLDIQNYFVDELVVRTNPDFKREKTGKCDIAVSFDLKRKGREPQFMISMTIEVNKAKKAFPLGPYYVLLNLGGIFSFPEGTEEATMMRMLGVNGTSILYGVARGVVGQATATCRHGKFVLPTVNFVELIKKQAKKKNKNIPST